MPYLQSVLKRDIPYTKASIFVCTPSVQFSAICTGENTSRLDFKSIITWNQYACDDINK